MDLSFYQNLNFSFPGQIFQYYLLGLKACRESLRLCHMAHSMKRIEILLKIRTNLKIETLYFFWFNVSKLLFISFFIQCFKTTICFIWFNVSRIFLSLTYKKLFAFPLTLFTSTPLYTHVHNPSCYPISNTLRQKIMSFTFSVSTTPI